MKKTDWPLWIFLVVGISIEFGTGGLCQNYFGMSSKDSKIITMVISELFIGSFIWGYALVSKYTNKLSAWFVFMTFILISSVIFYISLTRGVFPVLHYLWFYDYYLEILFIVLATVPSILIMRWLEKNVQHGG
jgi:hypothetical protein